MNLRFSVAQPLKRYLTKIEFRFVLLIVGAVASLGGLHVSANVTMPAIFGDHMVLQQDCKLAVWGWADPGEKVTVTVGKQTGTATADSGGSWRVDLAPVSSTGATAVPQTLVVAGKNTITFHDVLIGDVWIASGQSNMEFGVGMLEHPAEEIAKANEPMLRLFCVPKGGSLTPLRDIIPTGDFPYMGKWFVCTPEGLAKSGTNNGFSAVAYYFGREIQHAADHPVGIIDSNYGGTRAEAWTSVSGLEKDPALVHYVRQHDKIVENFPQALAVYPQQCVEYKAARDIWDKEVGTAYVAVRDAWNQKVNDARAKGLPPPSGQYPQPSRPPPPEVPIPDDGAAGPGNLFNCMIAPLIPYAIKGVVWYQGESNAGDMDSAREYGTLFPRLIADWREKWGQGDFPFIFVMLAAIGDLDTAPSEGSFPYARESQTKALALPNTGMAMALDLGNPFDIHPKDKFDVGLRLALAARHVAYGQDNVFSGPTFDSMQIEGNKIILSFKNVGGGLKIGAPPWVYDGKPIVTPDKLTGFGIAGADKNWFWAQAKIDGDKVILSSDKVPAPVAVRYGWDQNPPIDLYNKENLPAVPFRTDHWDQ